MPAESKRQDAIRRTLHTRLVELGFVVCHVNVHGQVDRVLGDAMADAFPDRVSLDTIAQLHKHELGACVEVGKSQWVMIERRGDGLWLGRLMVEDARELRLNSARWLIADMAKDRQQNVETESLGRELIHAYEELSLHYRFASNMNITEDPQGFLRSACEQLNQLTAFDWIALQTQGHNHKLGSMRDQLICVGHPATPMEVLREIGTTLMRQRPFGGALAILENPRSIEREHFPDHARQMLVVPMAGDGEALGVIFAGSRISDQTISSADAKLCNSLASSLSMFLENLMLYEESQEMFHGTLRALTAAIDAKDNYTHGHSERVALLSRELAEACGADRDDVQRAYLAGLIHDVGKIGVPENILSNPGKLTEPEFCQIRLHPGTGARILEGIPSMRPLLPGVLHHHERWDGQGYPHGLSGRDIPLLGRWVALADSFDAMSSDRAYRPRMPRDAVLKEIERCAGSQFDPDLVQVFLRMDFEDYDDLMATHCERAHRLAG